MTDPAPVMSPRSKRFADAVQRATRAAVLAHAQAGRPVADFGVCLLPIEPEGRNADQQDHRDRARELKSRNRK